MRIAQVAPPWLPIPPQGYGGVERVVATLTDGLVRRGHEVTLFACGGSHTLARLHAYHPEPLTTTAQVERPVSGLPHVLDAYARVDGFDVVHDHAFPFGPALGSLGASARVVHTVHVPPAAPYSLPIYELVDERLALVAVSGAQVRSAPGLRFAATIHNGIPVGEYDARRPKEDYLLFIGRMAAAKGVHLAVEIARRLGRPLRIAAKMQNAEEIAYFESRVEPLLTDDVVFLGELDGNAKVDLLGRAACTLVTGRWAEPFGLVMAESLASGTPVLALRHGAAPEIVDHGVTGFVGDDADELVRLAARIDDLDPDACRRAAEERFDADRMVTAYVDLYAGLTGAPSAGAASRQLRTAASGARA